MDGWMGKMMDWAATSSGQPKPRRDKNPGLTDPTSTLGQPNKIQMGEEVGGNPDDRYQKPGSQGAAKTGVSVIDQLTNQPAAPVDTLQASINAIIADSQKRADEAARQAQLADDAVWKATGMTVQEYLANMDQSALPMAEREAQNIATQGARNAAMAARSSGLNRGQSALAASRQTGDLYSGAYSGALERGRGLYQQGINQFQGMGRDAHGRSMGYTQNQIAGTGLGLDKRAQDTGIAQAQSDRNWATAGNVAGAAATALPWIIGAFSDERMKDDIQPAPDVSEIADAIDPVQFRYKGEPGDVSRVGVIAQDLEQSPLRDTVVDTPQGKMIDTVQLTPAILDMVVQLTKKIEALDGKKNARS